MDLAFCTRQLGSGAEIVRGFFTGLLDEEARWKPAPERWSMLEVLAHLLDEERDDFRRRIGLLLADPNEEWPPIDPKGWATERRYNERDVAATLDEFLRERGVSLVWLDELSADWSTTKHHPVFGSMSAGELLHAWVAHDLLHIRQLVRIRYEYAKVRLAPYGSEYAGEW